MKMDTNNSNDRIKNTNTGNIINIQTKPTESKKLKEDFKKVIKDKNYSKSIDNNPIMTKTNITILPTNSNIQGNSSKIKVNKPGKK
jgi:hypothetical protein